MVFIKEIGPSNEESHLDNVENKTRSGIVDFTRHIFSRAGQDTNSVLASPRDTDSAPSSLQDHKGKRQLTLQEVANEDERLRSGQGNKSTEKLVIPEGPLPGGMRRSDAGTSGDQRIGKQIGEYRLRSILGQGSFGKVYLGDHVDARKPPAAVKVLSIPLDRPEANQFFAEVKALERLKHDHIIKIYHYGLEEIEHRYPYLALEYAYHGALDDIHSEGTRLPSRQIAEYLDQLAPPLDYAHSQQFMHRDLKPGNLLVAKKPNGEQVLKIGDFGLALVFQRTSSRRTQGFAGTLEYAAPEQLRGKPGPESDLYAVGIMTYEWLSGHLPFQGTPAELIGQHMMEPPSPISGIAQDIQRVVFCALKKDPKDRFKSVAEFAQAFRRASGLPVPVQRAEAGPSRPVRDQLAEMRLQDTSERWIFRPEKLTCLRTLTGHNASVWSLGMHSGHLISGSGDKTIKIWDPNDGRYLRTLTGHNNIVYSLVMHNGHLISGSGDKTIKIWDPNDGRCLRTLTGHNDSVYSLVMHNGHLISGSGDSTIKVWDPNDGRCLRTLTCHNASVRSLAMHNEHLISGSGDKTIKVWDPNDGRCLRTLTGHNDSVRSLVMHSGHLISGSWDNTIKVWDPNDGRYLRTLTGHNDSVYSLVMHSGHLISGSWDNTIKVWDPNDGRYLRTLTGHNDSVYSLVMHNGHLISGSRDNTIKVWGER